MPLWLDLLRTPMAAPETRTLRRMRRVWQALCFSLAASIGGFGLVEPLFGALAPALVFVQIVLTLLYTALYVGQKQQADRAYLHERLNAHTPEERA